MLKKYRWLVLLILLAILFGVAFCKEEASEPIPIICTEPLLPVDGAEIPYKSGIMTFSFTPMEGAELYHLNILSPSGKLVTFELEGPGADRIISTFTIPGENPWYVEALNNDREIICTSDTFTFFAVQEPEPAPEVVDEEPEPTPTFTPTPTPLICSQPLTPANKAELPYIGKVIFSWTALDDVTQYILNITMPSGNIVTFEGEKTENKPQGDGSGLLEGPPIITW